MENYIHIIIIDINCEKEEITVMSCWICNYVICHFTLIGRDH